MSENKTERRVRVETEDVVGSDVRVAGRDVRKGGKEAASDASLPESTEVDVALGRVEEAQIVVAGRDVTEQSPLVTALQALERIVAHGLENRAQIDDLQGMIAELQAEGGQPPAERNVVKLRRIIRSIAEYVGLATLTAAQAQKVEALIEQVRHLLGL
jgi:hypothetical protein